MPDGLSRDEINELADQVRSILSAHKADRVATEIVRDTLEQLVSKAAGQLSEDERRSVASFAERLISAVWSDGLSVQDACSEIEQLAAAGAENASHFHRLLKTGHQG